MDINVMVGDYILNCRAVGIIINNNKILFQKKEKDKFWALPGGKISVGDTGEITIKREIFEELGINCEVERFHSVIENFFSFDNDKYHQYIFSYVLGIDKDSYIFNNDEFMGIEENKKIMYKWFKIDELENSLIKPDYLKSLFNDIDNKEIKFISNNEM